MLVLVSTSETPVNFFETFWRKIPDDSYHHTYFTLYGNSLFCANISMRDCTWVFHSPLIHFKSFARISLDTVASEATPMVDIFYFNSTSITDTNTTAV
jgi:hypothetical protein